MSRRQSPEASHSQLSRSCGITRSCKPRREDKIVEAIGEAKFLIVICSPKAAVSRHVDQEIKAFKRLGRSDRVLCLIVDGEPGASKNPASGQLEALPAAVRYQIGTEGELTGLPVEPLAADARRNKDGRTDAKLKLLAGILEVSFDELKQREKERRRRQKIQMVGLVLLVAMVIAVVWWRGYQLAERQRLIADMRQKAFDSLNIPERDADRRLQLALETVTKTRNALGHPIPEAVIALHRALDEIGGAHSLKTTRVHFGGWTWPVAMNTDGSRILAPSALGSTVVLNIDGERAAVLKDQERPYNHDNSAIFTSGGDTGNYGRGRWHRPNMVSRRKTSRTLSSVCCRYFGRRFDFRRFINSDSRLRSRTRFSILRTALNAIVEFARSGDPCFFSAGNADHLRRAVAEWKPRRHGGRIGRHAILGRTGSNAVPDSRRLPLGGHKQFQSRQ
jgi:MTH538 TIR-like domain (DUF1863)